MKYFSDSRPYDNVFFALSVTLLCVGFFMLASASIGLSTSKFGYPYYYLLHQFIFGVLPGTILFFVALRIPYHFWRKIALLLMLIAIFLMFLIFIPQLGFYHGGARRWLSFGSISFQPSEFLKFAYIIYLASWLESRVKHVGSFKLGFLPFALMSGFVASFVALQPDIGTLGTLLIAVAVLYFISGGKLLHLGLLILVGVLILGVLVVAEPYRFARVAVFLNPAHDPQGMGYQINQAMIAIGSGGIFGRGFGLSRQKFSFLPEPIGDSIFAITAEELGFVGGLALIILFLTFFWRGIIIAKKSPDLFGQLLSTGFLLLIIFQAFINIAAISGILPLTGIPLSFVSYGGSSLAIMMFEVGIILNISKNKVK